MSNNIEREYIVNEEVLFGAICREARGRKIEITGAGIKIESRTKTVEYKFKNFSNNFLQKIKSLKK